MMNAIKYSKYAIMPLAMYILTDFKIGDREKRILMNILILIGLVQLPIVIIQNIFYNPLANFAVEYVSIADFTTGTFWFKNDPGLNFFIISLICILLFFKHNYKKTKVNILIACFTLTVLFSNSLLSIVILIIIYLIHFLSISGIKTGGIKTKVKKYFLLVIAVTLLLLIIFGNVLNEKISDIIIRSMNISDGAVQKYLEGGYSRTAALLYLYSEPLKVFGDGVGAYVDLYTNEYKLGLKGQLFIFYAEIGIVGLLYSFFLSIVAVFTIVKKIRLIHLILLFAFVAFGYTSRPFTDLSMLVMFFLCIRLSNHYQTQDINNNLYYMNT